MLNMELQVRTPECGEGEKCMENIHRVAAVHDLSCFGRCSLAVILPVLSAMGGECCPLLTASLSAHTAFPPSENASFLDLTGQIGALLGVDEIVGAVGTDDGLLGGGGAQGDDLVGTTGF